METLIVPALRSNDKQEAILKTFDELKVGDSMLVIHDHDPLPLYSQMKIEKGNFEWNTIQGGPEVWKVQITKPLIAKAPEKESQRIGDIVAKDPRTADVFEKYGIDYCCGGKKTLQEVCLEMKVDYTEIQFALDHKGGETRHSNNYEDWSPAFLADYIYNQHHKYFYREDVAIKALMGKVIGHHLINHPFLWEVNNVYKLLSIELNAHFIKEEQQVFPSIRVLDYFNMTGQKDETAPFSSISSSIQMMESDHEDAGKLLFALRKLTNDFKPPADACNSFRVLYKKMSDLEKDLHLHIHLENHLLFPAAIRLEERITETHNRNVVF